MRNKNFTVINADILGLQEIRKFDIVLALDVIHHFLKTKEIFSRFVDYLRLLEAETIFLEISDLKSSFKRFATEEIVELICELTSLPNIALIGYSVKNFPIFKLSRNRSNDS